MKDEWMNPRPALLVAASRSGGTFLAHCLDSHIDIGCERGEPLHRDHIWQDYSTFSANDLLRQMLGRPGYRVSMCKVSYRQLDLIALTSLQEDRVSLIHLCRENVVRIVASALINTMAHKGEIDHPIHSFQRPPPVTLLADIDHFLAECARYEASVDAMLVHLRGLSSPLLELTYEQVIGEGWADAKSVVPQAGDVICDFLLVGRQSLRASLKRINPYPLSMIFTNWTDLAPALSAAGYGQWVDQERDHLRMWPS